MILDACCGPKEMYHGLHKKFTDQEIVYVDIRKGTFKPDNKMTETYTITPTIQADLKTLPFKNGAFNAIIFDPPHGDFGLHSFMLQKFGGLSMSDYRDVLIWGNIEFNRVLVEGGILLAKIQDIEDREYYMVGFLHNFKLLLDIKYESRGAIKDTKRFTHWMVFVKKPVPIQTALSDTAPQPQEALQQPKKYRHQTHLQPLT